MAGISNAGGLIINGLTARQRELLLLLLTARTLMLLCRQTPPSARAGRVALRLPRYVVHSWNSPIHTAVLPGRRQHGAAAGRSPFRWMSPIMDVLSILPEGNMVRAGRKTPTNVSLSCWHSTNHSTLHYEVCRPWNRWPFSLLHPHTSILRRCITWPRRPR